MKRAWWLVAALAGFSLAGCGGAYAGYYASVPPPPARAEVYGAAPGPGFVWVSGFYSWRGGRYQWVGGHWARPPRHGAVWESGHWERRNDRYSYHEGRWR